MHSEVFLKKFILTLWLLHKQWIDEADVDGFNLAYISNPGSFEDIVELLVPVLRERGMIFDDYCVPGGTFRENLLRQPGQKTLRDDHYGSTFTFEREVAGVSANN